MKPIEAKVQHNKNSKLVAEALRWETKHTLDFKLIEAAGGIPAFVFFGEEYMPNHTSHRCSATITCEPDGISALIEDHETNKLAAWDVRPEFIWPTLDIISAFLR